jgi:hypothetical protein
MLTRQLALIALLLCWLTACRQPDEVPVEPATQTAEAARLPNSIHVADPGVATQLKSGLHTVEQSAWCWTERRFAFALGTPQDIGPNGAILSLRFTLPEPTLNLLKKITLSASVGGVNLPPATYSKVGEHIYTAEVPASLLAGDTILASFELDQAIPPNDVDHRELGVIVSTVSIE